MNLFSGFDPNLVNWFILPFFIFCARIFDVSIGTIRIILVGKGIKKLAALMGFFEVLIWIIAIGQIMQNLNNIFCYVGYATGFATGTYIGIILENKIFIGKVLLRIITRKDSTELLDFLITYNYHLTAVDAEGRFGDVKIIFIILNRKEIPDLIKIINNYNPQAFWTIEDIRHVNQSYKNTTYEQTYSKQNFFRRVFSPRK
jgi:uncharacterized protein YebE (UPF0316 family)